MNLIRLLFKSSLIFLISVISGKTQEILSGEHGAFSRLVFELPSGETWDFQNSGDRVDLKFSLPRLVLNVSNVFQKIDRDRIKNVISTPGYLSIELACECDVEVSRYRESFVIIDVSDLASRAGEPLETYDVFPAIWRLQPLIQSYKVADNFFEELIKGETQYINVKPNGERKFLHGITAGISESLAAGIISPRRENWSTTSQMSSTITEESKSYMLPTSDYEQRLDFNTSEIILDKNMVLDGSSRNFCSSDYLLTLEMWNEDDSFENVLAEIQMLISGAPHLMPQRDDIIAAVMKYFTLGFGAEGRALLDIFDYREDFLRSISYLLDGKTLGPNSHLSQSYGCSSQMALWAIVSQGSIPHLAPIREDDLVKSALDLPPFVKQAIGKSVIQRLRSAGLFPLALRLETAFNLKVIPPLINRIESSSASNALQASLHPSKSDFLGANADVAIVNELNRYIANRSAAPDYLRNNGASLISIITESHRRVNLFRAIILSDLLSGNISRGVTLLREVVDSKDLNQDFWSDFESIVSNNLDPAQFFIVSQLVFLNSPPDQEEVITRLKKISEKLGLSDLMPESILVSSESSSLLMQNNYLERPPKLQNTNPSESRIFLETQTPKRGKSELSITQDEIKKSKFLLDLSRELRSQASALLKSKI